MPDKFMLTTGKGRKKTAKRIALILMPVREGLGWTWPQLEVKQSKEKGAGQGLFAKVDLLAGAVIPYLGKPTTKRGTHIFNGLDGNPKISPYKGVGNRGLSIAAMTNEPVTKKPRCKFTRGYLVVAQKVKAGEELTVYYGPDYHRIGYSLNKNKHLDKQYPELEKVRKR
jgi:hypothetical protein